MTPSLQPVGEAALPQQDFASGVFNRANHLQWFPFGCERKPLPMVNFTRLLKITPYVTIGCKHYNRKDVSIYLMSHQISLIYTPSYFLLEWLLGSCRIQLRAALGSKIAGSWNGFELRNQETVCFYCISWRTLRSPFSRHFSPAPQPNYVTKPWSHEHSVTFIHVQIPPNALTDTL